MNLAAFMSDTGMPGGTPLGDTTPTDDTFVSADDAFDSEDGWGEVSDEVSADVPPADNPIVGTETPDQAENFTAIDPRTLAPELQVQYRNMQADYTRKTQAVADARRALESDPTFALVQHVQGLRTDPVALHNFLTEQAQLVAGYAQSQGLQVGTVPPGNQEPEPDFADAILGDQYATENERALAQTVKSMQEQLANLGRSVQPITQQQQQQQALQQGHAVMNDTFAGFERNFGRALTGEEKTEIAAAAVQAGVQNQAEFTGVMTKWALDKVRGTSLQQGQEIAAAKQRQAEATGAQNARVNQGGSGGAKAGMSLRQIAEGVVSGQIR